MTDNLFMGKNGFIWWFGVVEDNGDPHGLGRCRVRIVGWHNPDDTIIPTEALPWAYPIHGLDSFGKSNAGPPPNTRVFGFFSDGETGQQPVMLGILSGMTTKATFKKGQPGATRAQPIYDKLFGNAPLMREGACPVGDAAQNSTTNEVIPDPRNIKVNPAEWVLPATGFVSSPYGARAGNMHAGVDIATVGFYPQSDAGAPHVNGAALGPVGNSIMAAAAGTVIYKWTKDKGQRGAPSRYDEAGTPTRSYGNAIAIQHQTSTGPFITIYAHLGKSQDPATDGPGTGINVAVGAKVSAGQVIGTMGRTHNRDTLTHLHFETRVGTALPKSSNHFNPGIIFPQLGHKHTAYLPNKIARYSDPPTNDPTKAPVIAGTPPQTA